jgi:uncharacterized protein YkwD
MHCPRSVIIGLSFALLMGCFEWTEDSQGNLRSVGVPGLPVWQAQPTPARTESGGASDASSAPPDPQIAELSASGAGNGTWLAELNRWRESAGVAPVSENSELSAGSRQHARYLVMQGPQDDETFPVYTGGLGAAGHTGAAGSKWYTAAGAEAAPGR